MAQVKLEEAVACYRLALASDLNHAPAHNNLGIALINQGQLDEAITRRCLALNPHDSNGAGLALAYLGAATVSDQLSVSHFSATLHPPRGPLGPRRAYARHSQPRRLRQTFRDGRLQRRWLLARARGRYGGGRLELGPDARLDPSLARCRRLAHAVEDDLAHAVAEFGQ